ncbi:MAG: hypothetical protein HN390_09560 [Anaerolineae bacterium]|jgi:hypothetical protein|nr:hypothetical protein [Anaerolineae bacterium]MBT7190068.1 hypothetical protein [Anaerolineae bacterium]
MNMKLRHLTIFVLLTGVITACGGGVTPAEMTAQALGQSISLTATAGANNGFDAQAELETAVAQATASAGALAATQSAQAGLNAEAMAATATAEAPIRSELPTYGIDPVNGHVGWIHPPASLSVTGYLKYDYINQFIGTVAENFVVSTDITWDTQYGTSGCGLVLRSNGNEDALSQYLVIATRGANGHIVFSSMEDGKLRNGIDSYANYLDPKFQVQNGATNRLTVVGRGNTLTIFTNGVQIDQVVAGDQPVLTLPSAPTPPPEGASTDQLAQFDSELSAHGNLVNRISNNYKPNLAIIQAETPYFERGFVALVALSESGTTNCEFNNSWLWIIDK